jgi:integrase
MDAMNSSRNERRYIENLMSDIGDLAIGDVRPMDIQAVANALYPGCANETKNRQAYTPAASVLHWACENELRDYVVIRKLPEKRPETRAPRPNVRDLLLANSEGRERLLLTVLFYQGWRITETLGLRVEHVHLTCQELTLYVSKSRAWKTIPMHPATFEALANAGLPEAGNVFPWRDRHAVYRWLRPLCKRLNVEFTPHMARHDFGTKIRDASDLVAVGSWTSEKSTQRYVGTPQERLNLVFAKLDTKGNRKGRESK